MHRAVQVHRCHTLLVRLQNVLHIRHFLHVRGAFVVDDDIEPLRPIGLVVDLEPRLGGAVIGVDLHHFHIGPLLQAPLEDVLLFGVIVATAAGDEQGAQRLFVGGQGGGNGGCDAQSREGERRPVAQEDIHVSL